MEDEDEDDDEDNKEEEDDDDDNVARRVIRDFCKSWRFQSGVLSSLKFKNSNLLKIIWTNAIFQYDPAWTHS